MHSMIRARPAFFLVALALACLVAACDEGPGAIGGITPTPTQNPALVSTLTAAPVVPAPQTLALGAFQARVVIGMAKGLVLLGAPKGTPATNAAGDTSLSFYDFTKNAVSTLASATPAPDGTARGIGDIVTGGDWVVYMLYDALHGNWEIQAINVATGDHHLIDSAANEQNSGILSGSFGTDGVDVVWALPNPTTRASVLRDDHLASGKVKTLSYNQTATYGNIVMRDGLLFYQTFSYTADDKNVVASWLWRLRQPAPTMIKATIVGRTALNSRYIVWDDPAALWLYDSVTDQVIAGQNQQPWVSQCSHPLLAADRPFVVCLDDGKGNFNLVRTPTGASTPFAVTLALGYAAIANDRVYFIPLPGAASTNNQISYFDLPTN